MTTENTENATKEATASVQGAVAQEKAKSKNAASAKNGAPKGKKPGKATGKSKKRAKGPKEGGRAGSKTSSVLDLLHRAKGATLAEIMDATGWQGHSVRGFMSGILGKKMGLTVTSEKRDGGTRVYSIAK